MSTGGYKKKKCARTKQILEEVSEYEEKRGGKVNGRRRRERGKTEDGRV